jgi:hypothetical protein
MLKLNASFMRKVPGPEEFSSLSYHASIDLELSDGLTAEQIQDRIQRTFGLVRDSVDEEITRHHQPRGGTALPAPENKPQPRTAASTRSPSGRSNGKASPKQLKYLVDLALRHDLTVDDLNSDVANRFGVQSIQGLTRQQASDMIDALNDKAA